MKHLFILVSILLMASTCFAQVKKDSIYVVTESQISAGNIDSLKFYFVQAGSWKKKNLDDLVVKLRSKSISITLAATKPSPLSTFVTDVVIDTVGTDSAWVWNASIYRLLLTGGGSTAPSALERGDSVVVVKSGQLYYKNDPRVFNVKDFGALGNNSNDDTQEIQATIDAAFAAGGGVIYFPNGVYRLAGALDGTTNSQLVVPTVFLETAVTSRPVLIFQGETSPQMTVGAPYSTWSSPTITGVVLYSVLNNTNTGSIIASPGGGFSGFGGIDVTYGGVEFYNMQFRVKSNVASGGPTMSALDARKFATVIIKNCKADIDTVYSYAVTPTAETFGFRLSRHNNETMPFLENVYAGGFRYGFVFAEHAQGTNINAHTCMYGFVFAGTTHSTTFGRLNAHWCTYALSAQVGTVPTSPSNIYTNIQMLNVEAYTTSHWAQQISTIYDPSNRIIGNLNYHVVQAGVGVNQSLFTKSGGSNLICTVIGANTGASILNGGNTTGADLTIGTNDNNGLIFRTNSASRIGLSNVGDFRWASGASGEKIIFSRTPISEGTFTSPFSVAAINAAENDGENLTITAKNLWQRVVSSTAGVLISEAGNGILPTARLNVAVSNASSIDALNIYRGTTNLFKINSFGNIARGNGINTSRVNVWNLYNEAGTRLISRLDTFGHLRIVSRGDSPSFDRGLNLEHYETNSNNTIVRFKKARGTEASPTVVSNGDNISALIWQARGNTAFSQDIAYIGVAVSGTFTGNDVPLSMYFASGSVDGGAAPNLLLHHNRNIGIGGFGSTGSFTTPTAKLHLAAGTATASTAPLKLTTGTLLTTPEAGAIEFASSRLTFTPASTRHDVLLIPSTEQPSVAGGTKANVLYTGNGSANAATYSYFQSGVFSGTTDSNGDIQLLFPSALPDVTYSIIVTVAGTTLYSCTAHTKATGGVYIRCFSNLGIVLGAGVSIDLNYEARDY